MNTNRNECHLHQLPLIENNACELFGEKNRYRMPNLLCELLYCVSANRNNMFQFYCIIISVAVLHCTLLQTINSYVMELFFATCKKTIIAVHLISYGIHFVIHIKMRIIFLSL